ncbi:MAG: helix-turn-helix transcriptional regulator [Caulobacteraceae bacterium]
MEWSRHRQLTTVALETVNRAPPPDAALMIALGDLLRALSHSTTYTLTSHGVTVGFLDNQLSELRKLRESIATRRPRGVRTALDISQERLAADAGIDRAYVSEIEREQGNATLDLLDRLADALGVSVVEFFLEADGDPPAPLRKGRRARRSS